MLIGIFGGRVPDEVKNFESNLLRHKLGLTNSHSLESELRLTLNKPRFDVVWPERGQLPCDSVEQVGGGESGMNSLDDS